MEDTKARIDLWEKPESEEKGRPLISPLDILSLGEASRKVDPLWWFFELKTVSPADKLAKLNTQSRLYCLDMVLASNHWLMKHIPSKE